jgi:hypothetical protein
MPLSDNPMIYRTRAQFVEAYLFTADTAEAIAAWSGGTVQMGPGRELYLELTARDGSKIRCLEGMYVVKEQDGHYTFMAQREFDGKYEHI